MSIFERGDNVDKLNQAIGSHDSDAALALLKEAGDACAVKALAKEAQQRHYDGYTKPFSDYTIIAHPTTKTETIIVSNHETHSSRQVAGIELPECVIK